MEVITKHDLWRDLHIGEEIKAGDRALRGDLDWDILTERCLDWLPVITRCSPPIQRKVERTL